MALLCLWLRNQGHIWPYLPIYGHIWPFFFGHPESTASIRFDHCFWSLRVIVVIDEIFCVLRGLAKTTEKKHVYVVTGIYNIFRMGSNHQPENSFIVFPTDLEVDRLLKVCFFCHVVSRTGSGLGRMKTNRPYQNGSGSLISFYLIPHL